MADNENDIQADLAAASSSTGVSLTLESEGNQSAMAPATKSVCEPSGGRKRKRHLYNAIRAQMEFYFGDANLSKDRFLRRYVEENPFVPLEIFLSFNKIKSLTHDVEHIVKSLSKSELLQLDESGQKVCRKMPLPQNRDVTDKTLYVEALPANASHEWLKEVFSRYGPVAYVSLPHYPGTRKIKEFAFIEFENSASVEKAVKAFSQIHGVLSMEHTDPSHLASVRSFQQQQQLQKTKKQNTEIAQQEQNMQTPDVEQEADDAGPVVKRIKLETTDINTPNNETSNVAAVSSAAVVVTKCEAEPSDSNVEEQQEQEEAIDESPGEDTEEHQCKMKKMHTTSKPNIDPTAMDLKVLPKNCWSRLRNKYLNLQRRIVNEAKTKLRHNSEQAQKPQTKRTPMQALHHHPAQQMQESKVSNSDGGSVRLEENEQLSDGGDGSPPIPAKRRKRSKNSNSDVHKMNMNFYGAGGSETDDTKPSITKIERRQPLFKYEPGLIVECVLHEPCVTVKDFKADMRQYTNVKYVDIKEGAQIAHMRMSTPEAAMELVRQIDCAEMKCNVLHGQAEIKYWRKIEQDRQAKVTKQVHVQQRRGREKVAKILAKHIKFDESDGEENGVEAEQGPVALEI